MFYQDNYSQENQMRQLVNMVPGYGDSSKCSKNQTLNHKIDYESLETSDTSSKNGHSHVIFF
jgi:NADH:ubiquinone oxidoreductase subunit F (NADH-binding)